MNTHLLQIRLTPAEYRAILPTKSIVFHPAQIYLRSLPVYLLARCPLCQNRYTTSLDTYSLTHWEGAIDGRYVFDENYQDTGCAHFVFVHHFINSNGFRSRELTYLSKQPEVPFVIPKMLEEESSFGVMHALPICRIEHNQFVPRYSLYTITYYSQEPHHKRLELGNLQVISELGELHGIANISSIPGLIKSSNVWWDLPYWVRQDKLCWLDPHDPDLPLRHGSVETFPYRNITGLRLT